MKLTNKSAPNVIKNIRMLYICRTTWNFMKKCHALIAVKLFLRQNWLHFESQPTSNEDKCEICGFNASQLLKTITLIFILGRSHTNASIVQLLLLVEGIMECMKEVTLDIVANKESEQNMNSTLKVLIDFCPV